MAKKVQKFKNLKKSQKTMKNHFFFLKNSKILKKKKKNSKKKKCYTLSFAI